MVDFYVFLKMVEHKLEDDEVYIEHEEMKESKEESKEET